MIDHTYNLSFSLRMDFFDVYKSPVRIFLKKPKKKKGAVEKPN